MRTERSSPSSPLHPVDCSRAASRYLKPQISCRGRESHAGSLTRRAGHAGRRGRGTGSPRARGRWSPSPRAADPRRASAPPRGAAARPAGLVTCRAAARRRGPGRRRDKCRQIRAIAPRRSPTKDTKQSASTWPSRRLQLRLFGGRGRQAAPARACTLLGRTAGPHTGGHARCPAAPPAIRRPNARPSAAEDDQSGSIPSPHIACYLGHAAGGQSWGCFWCPGRMRQREAHASRGPTCAY